MPSTEDEDEEAETRHGEVKEIAMEEAAKPDGWWEESCEGLLLPQHWTEDAHEQLIRFCSLREPEFQGLCCVVLSVLAALDLNYANDKAFLRILRYGPYEKTNVQLIRCGMVYAETIHDLERLNKEECLVSGVFYRIPDTPPASWEKAAHSQCAQWAREWSSEPCPPPCPPLEM